jgi:hypothetical protein
LHADGLGALLGEGGGIEDQHAVGLSPLGADLVGQFREEGLVFPVGLSDELLQSLSLAVMQVGNGLGILAGQVGEEALVVAGVGLLRPSRGTPADPALLVALWLYATLEGVGSARYLDSLCTHHNAFRWLCGGVRVNYHSLADFRVAQDGMRVRASAGAASFRRRPTLEECLLEAKDQVARLNEEMQDDPSAPSRRHAAAWVKSRP